MDEAPDFNALYANEKVITPRVAKALWTHLSALAEIWGDEALDPEGVTDGFVNDLPPVALAAADAVWLTRFAQCFGDLADRLAAGDISNQFARCTGEEMALHFTLSGLHENAESDGYPGGIGPTAITDDEIEAARDALVDDFDVLLLFDPQYDGVENDLDDRRRFANLRPDRWFLPFDPT